MIPVPWLPAYFALNSDLFLTGSEHDWNVTGLWFPWVGSGNAGADGWHHRGWDLLPKVAPGSPFDCWGRPMDPELFDLVAVFELPMKLRFRGITVRDGIILHGSHGWAEFAPFHNYTDEQCVPWLRAAVEAATGGWPAPVRDRVAVNTTVPVVKAAVARELVAASGCLTAKVKVADPGSSLVDDASRVGAVREALGAGGAIRIDANGGWDVDSAVRAIRVLDRAAGGLEYVEQPCATVPELAAVRRQVAVPIAADESIRLASDPLLVALAGAADIAVLKAAPWAASPGHWKLPPRRGWRLWCPRRWTPRSVWPPHWRWPAPCPHCPTPAGSVPEHCSRLMSSLTRWYRSMGSWQCRREPLRPTDWA